MLELQCRTNAADLHFRADAQDMKVEVMSSRREASVKRKQEAGYELALEGADHIVARMTERAAQLHREQGPGWAGDQIASPIEPASRHSSSERSSRTVTPAAAAARSLRPSA